MWYAVATAESRAAEAAASGASLEQFVLLLTIFVLAIFIGFEIITKIPPTLHTPLMSGSNAISGITLVGALLSLKTGNPLLAKCLGFAAVVLATINVVGGFLVTHRMLGMFRRKD
jgi:NAD(P) transhydrogenase subunit alpha